MTARTEGGITQLRLRLRTWDSTGKDAIWSLALYYSVNSSLFIQFQP